jgi:hypothetical protein
MTSAVGILSEMWRKGRSLTLFTLRLRPLEEKMLESTMLLRQRK